MVCSSQVLRGSFPLALVLLCRLSSFTFATRLNPSQRLAVDIHEVSGELRRVEEAPSPKEEVSATDEALWSSLPTAVLEVSDAITKSAKPVYSLYKGCDYHDIKEKAEKSAPNKRQFLDGWCKVGLKCGLDSGRKTWEKCAAECDKKGFCVAFAFKYDVLDEKNSACHMCRESNMDSPQAAVDYGIWMKVGDDDPPAAEQTTTTGMTKIDEVESPRTVVGRQAETNISDSSTKDIEISDRNYCEAKWTCSGPTWNLVERKGKGAYGQVWSVKSPDDNGADPIYALKFPVSYTETSPRYEQGDCKDIRVEAKRMQEIERNFASLPAECANTVMFLKDAHPCVDGAPKPGSYVSELMDGNLDEWRKAEGKKPGVLARCLPGITKKVMDAINCFHQGNWVHADIKLANILWKGLVNDCPQDLRLADFGMSGQKDTATRNMFSFSNYRDCWYLPSDMFFMPMRELNKEDTGSDLYTLNLAQPVARKFTHGVGLDWCAFHIAWKTFFGKNPGNPHWSGDCGLMGPYRKAAFSVLKA